MRTGSNHRALFVFQCMRICSAVEKNLSERVGQSIGWALLVYIKKKVGLSVYWFAMHSAPVIGIATKLSTIFPEIQGKVDMYFVPGKIQCYACYRRFPKLTNRIAESIYIWKENNRLIMFLNLQWA